MAASKRYICIHGHFYQPPRENPWLETVETQDSAAPYHDWNERVCTECYAPNSAARIVNDKQKITRIVNNYARISFNVGPTLLGWLKENEPQTYRMILDGERRSRKAFFGHSSAMAQVYNHMILPLANQRDRITQIRWGIADYEKHYGAPPEGMWLAETAADTKSLELLAENGIKFTILAPHQCKRIRPLQADAPWTDTTQESVDTTHPYLLRFPSGASISVFFYNGQISQAIAFEGLLNSGEAFANRLKSGFDNRPEPQLVHVATDGESYGHHHKYGEMALAYALRLFERDKSLRLTNYGSFLEFFPPEYECEIVDNTSWSCAHGVERWRSDCGCNGGKAGWNQAWRAPLRQALDQLRDALIPLTEQEGGLLFRDVWAARDSYINVVLDRSPETVDEFLAAHQSRPLTEFERMRALELMEMQRHAMLMYTSCGWFFDDIAGIETVQIIAYAARVLQLARSHFGLQADPLEPAFLACLAKAKSNVPSAGDGASIYKECVRTKALHLEQVAAHYAISSVFSSFSEETELFCYSMKRISHEIHASGSGKLAMGRVQVTNTITGHNELFSYAVLHFGDQNITAAVKPYTEVAAADFEAFASEAAKYVQRADFPQVIRLLDRTYGSADYSLTSLFTDEQRRIIHQILSSTLTDIETSLTSIYQDHASLLHYLSLSGLPKPAALNLAAGFAINAGLRHVLKADPIDQAQMRSLLALAKSDQVELETAELSFQADERMKNAMIDLQMAPDSLEILEHALSLGHCLSELPFELNLWQAQNIWYEILRTSSAAQFVLDEQDRALWDQHFNELGGCLSIDYETVRAEVKFASA